MQNYHASIEKHTLQEGVELLMLFIEDFAKQLHQETKAPEQDYASALFAKLAWGFGAAAETPVQKEPVNLYAAAKEISAFQEMNERDKTEILQTLSEQCQCT